MWQNTVAQLLSLRNLGFMRELATCPIPKKPMYYMGKDANLPFVCWPLLNGMALRGKDGTLFLQPKKGPSNLTGSKKKTLTPPICGWVCSDLFFGLEC
jgi:hypothetical protein